MRFRARVASLGSSGDSFFPAQAVATATRSAADNKNSVDERLTSKDSEGLFSTLATVGGKLSERKGIPGKVGEPTRQLDAVGGK